MEVHDLEDKAILVTGATGTIGMATVKRVLDGGARVVATDVRDADSGELMSLAERSALSYHACDIRAERQVSELLDLAVDRLGTLDGAANVAGIVGDSVRTADFEADGWQRVVDVNLRGTWLCMKYELRAMLVSGAGSIVNVASIAGHVGEVERSPYVASKAGVVGLSKTAAVEYAERGIRVNAVSPGPIDTPQFRTNVGAPGSPRFERVAKAQPLRRLGRAEEIADVLAWLLSDRSSFVVGHELIADGGLVAEGLPGDPAPGDSFLDAAALSRTPGEGDPPWPTWG
jgi:NAD(P)-dependent dehydrogenase (short-subunit alcohol dehydrogenase family)